jgi:CRISPR-associated protein Csb3
MVEDRRLGSLVLEMSEPLSLLSHMAFYGLSSILEADGRRGLRLAWTSGMTPRPELSGPGLDDHAVGEALRRHAADRAGPGSWPSEQFSVAGKQRGLMSPRVGTIDDWDGLQDRRCDVLDRLGDEEEWVDLRLLWSLGEPCYWRFDKAVRRQDDAASRLEMQPRNHGSEIVGNRFAPLAAFLAECSPEAITAGLRGIALSDQLGKNQSDSHSGTGFCGPGPVDDAVAWGALWGISQFPLVQSTRRQAATAGHIGAGGAGSFYVPVWAGEWTPSRLRTVLASRQLCSVATEAATPDGSIAAVGQSVGWLAGRGVRAVITFPVERFGSASAPERRAQRGRLQRLAAVN